MKTGSLLAAVFLLAAGVVLIRMKLRHNDNDLSISVKTNHQHFEYQAKYNKSHTGDVEHYIALHTQPNNVFNHRDHHVKTTVILNDGTNFYINSSPGELNISMDKRVNTKKSINRINKMCSGIGDIINKRQPPHVSGYKLPAGQAAAL